MKEYLALEQTVEEVLQKFKWLTLKFREKNTNILLVENKTRGLSFLEPNGLQKFRNNDIDETPSLFTIIFQVKYIFLVQAFKIKRIPMCAESCFKRFLLLTESVLDSMLSKMNVL